MTLIYTPPEAYLPWIYVKSKKTGSSSLESYLLKENRDKLKYFQWYSTSDYWAGPGKIHGNSHFAIWKIKNKENHFSWTVVRNPWDKMVSSYANYININKNNLLLDFDDWCFSYHPLEKRDWQLYAQKEKILVDKILFYEDLERELTELFTFLNFPFSWEEYQKYQIRNFDHNFTRFDLFKNKKTIKYIGNLFHNEVKTFGYTFEDEI